MSRAAFPVVESSQLPGAPRWPEGVWEMLVDAIRTANSSDDRLAIAKICKAYQLSRHTYKRVTKSMEQGDSLNTPSYEFTEFDLRLDALHDECEDVCYILREWADVVEALAYRIDFELRGWISAEGG